MRLPPQTRPTGRVRARFLLPMPVGLTPSQPQPQCDCGGLVDPLPCPSADGPFMCTCDFLGALTCGRQAYRRYLDPVSDGDGNDKRQQCPGMPGNQDCVTNV